MTESERLRAQAERCFRLATEAVASDVAATMYKLASDYLALAHAVEQAASGQQQQQGSQLPPPAEHRQQPALQQQQVQPNDKDDGA